MNKRDVPASSTGKAKRDPDERPVDKSPTGITGTSPRSASTSSMPEIPVDAILAGSFDLVGMLAGLDQIKLETGARTVVFDDIDVLLSSLPDEQLERRELGRLDEWIRATDMSALVTVYEALHGQMGREIAEMTTQLQAATQELEWKTQEAAILAASEGERAVNERSAADDRLQFRVGPGLAPPPAQPRGRKAKG